MTKMDLLEQARCKSPYLHGSSAERMIDELAADIERLRHETTSMALQSLDAEKRLRAEVERLRAFIQGCSTCKEEWGRMEARAALEPKP